MDFGWRAIGKVFRAITLQLRLEARVNILRRSRKYRMSAGHLPFRNRQAIDPRPSTAQGSLTLAVRLQSKCG